MQGVISAVCHLHLVSSYVLHIWWVHIWWVHTWWVHTWWVPLTYLLP